MPNWCDARLNSILLPSNDNLTLEVDSRNLSITFVKSENKSKKLSDFTLMQTFNSTTCSNSELDRFVSKTAELKRVSFQQVKKVLKQIDENYPFVMLIGY